MRLMVGFILICLVLSLASFFFIPFHALGAVVAFMFMASVVACLVSLLVIGEEYY